MIRRGPAAIGVALCACGGTLFVDPTPPRLRRAFAQYTTSAVPEPLVWVPLLDLYLEDTGSCAFAKSWFVESAQRAMQGLATDQVALAPRDLSPRCTQREGVVLDVEGIVSEVRSAALARPLAHVRPVILYANGLDLPLPPARSQSLGNLEARLTAQLGIAPLVWLVASQVVTRQLVADFAQDWTYAGDPAMAVAMRGFAQTSFPLQTELGTVSEVQPLLGGPDLERAKEVKLCFVDPAGTVSGLTGQLGVAAPLDRSRPPAWQVLLPPQLAATRTSFSTHTVVARLELCDGDCNRFYRIDPDQTQQGWDIITGCLLGGMK